AVPLQQVVEVPPAVRRDVVDEWIRVRPGDGLARIDVQDGGREAGVRDLHIDALALCGARVTAAAAGGGERREREDQQKPNCGRDREAADHGVPLSPMPPIPLRAEFRSILANRSLRYPMLSASATASALGSAVSRRSVVPSCSQSSTLPVTVNRCSPSGVSRESWCGPEIQKASWLPTWTAWSVVSAMISLDASGSLLPGSSMRIVLHGVPSIRGCDASASHTSTTTRDENTVSATCTSA